ncbi:MAG: hypothetical protein L3J56_00980 [Bacteroidales bacterium]|nr:hypothetical protein [Bacteroidales bacterium]
MENSKKIVTISVDIETLKILLDFLIKEALNRNNKVDWAKFQKLTRLSLDLILAYNEKL